jgi:hypothetical protein
MELCDARVHAALVLSPVKRVLPTALNSSCYAQAYCVYHARHCADIQQLLLCAVLLLLLQQLTAADLMCAQMVVWLTSGLLEGVSTALIDDYPALKAVKRQVYSNPCVQAHFARQSASTSATSSPRTAAATAATPSASSSSSSTNGSSSNGSSGAAVHAESASSALQQPLLQPLVKQEV